MIIKIYNRISILLLVMLIAFMTISQVAYAKETDANKDVVCNIGSVSKTFTTVAVLMLVEEGKIDLDEPVITYIPEFRMNDERYKDITVRMLLNHTSGIMGTTMGDSFLFEDNDSSSHDKLLERLSMQRLKANPGEYGVYCNDGFWLAELLIERVSGESYTDYIDEHISKKLGLKQTGTPYNMFATREAIDIFLPTGDRIGHEYVMDIGSGGIISTAPELCIYGSTFFKGNNTLLSDESKAEMEKNNAGDEYESPYGLGWDSVELYPYKDVNVKILEKGGSTKQQFTDLIVAPDEGISIAVLSSGQNPLGSTAMARTLMSVVLEEKGINVPEPDNSDLAVLDSIPDSYKKYEGVYTDGKTVYSVAFPDMKYMSVCEYSEKAQKTDYYKLTKDDGFVLLNGKPENNIQNSNHSVYRFFERENGKVYIVEDEAVFYDGFGTYINKSYFAEKMEENPVEEKTVSAWMDRAGDYSLLSGKYSNMMFSENATRIIVPDIIDGYVIFENRGVCKMIDENKAEGFVQIPCQNGRDVQDVAVCEQNGKIVLDFINADLKFVNNSSFPELDDCIRKVNTTKDSAVWYSINASMQGRTAKFNNSKETSIYVFDNNENMIYSTYMLDYPAEVALPSEGKIAFIGENNKEIEISYLE